MCRQIIYYEFLGSVLAKKLVATLERWGMD